MPQKSSDVVLLRISDVLGRVGLSRSKIYDAMGAGKFPRPVYPAKKAPRWRSDDISAWIEKLPTERSRA